LGGCEHLREKARAILSGEASRTDSRAALAEALDAISQASGCESVEIRWKAGEDYPYHVTRGFGRDFVVIEGPLCERDTAGLVLRYPDGTPQYACMCGAVVTGSANPRLPFFTEGGSFWTNGTTVLLKETPPEAMTGIKTRNYCNAAGYESVALIPMRARGKTWGLLQLNSREPGRFTKQQIEAYEVLASEIAEAAVEMGAGGSAGACPRNAGP
jgi:GAF domain-containing protein